MTDDGVWVLALPWLRPPLTLNMRWPHPAVENKVRQEVKQAGWALAKQARIPQLGAVIVELVYYPANNRRQDGDNLAPTIKYLTDGLVLAKVIPDDSADRVLDSRCRIVLKRDDPYPSGRPRLRYVIKDASVLAGPLPHYA